MTMDQEIEAIFDVPAIETWRTIEPLKYSFRLKNIPTNITVSLSIPRGGRRGFNFRLSHAIHTPTQMGPYHPGIPWGDDLPSAVHQAVMAITSYYDDAVKEGHAPTAEWLVFNRFG
ncbi:MAG: hypothetical protein ACTHOL_18090 [Luteibacter jiangsuensis]